jgi:hypothetical protein
VTEWTAAEKEQAELPGSSIAVYCPNVCPLVTQRSLYVKSTLSVSLPSGSKQRIDTRMEVITRGEMFLNLSCATRRGVFVSASSAPAIIKTGEPFEQRVGGNPKR